LKEEIDPFLIFFAAMLKITPDVLLFPFRRGVDIFMVGLPISIRKQITYSTK
jgi:hypothetical protein